MWDLMENHLRNSSQKSVENYQQRQKIPYRHCIHPPHQYSERQKESTMLFPRWENKKKRKKINREWKRIREERPSGEGWRWGRNCERKPHLGRVWYRPALWFPRRWYR